MSAEGSDVKRSECGLQNGNAVQCSLRGETMPFFFRALFAEVGRDPSVVEQKRRYTTRSCALVSAQRS
jgi:hypothetical protein